MDRLTKLCLFLISIQFSSKAISQTVFDYSIFSTTQCNAFYPSATINGSIHTTTAGTVVYDNTNHLLALDNKLVSASAYGTEFKLTYNFKQYYSYVITVNAYSILSTPSEPFPWLIVDLNSISHGNGNACTGPELLNSPAKYSQISPNAPIDYNISLPSLSSSSNFLYVASYRGFSGDPSEIGIKKITITETPPPPTFTLSPASIAKVCGTSLSKTFVVTNVYGTPGVTGYTWSLGANNGWKYNGTAAPATINTPTGTITLTTDDCINALSNVAATALIGGTGYNTNVAVTTLSNPSTPINGSSTLCDAGTYSLGALPCGATVIWSLSQSGIVTSPNPLTGLSTSVSKIVDGSVVLKANVASACGNYVISKPIDVAGVPTDFSIQANVPCQPGKIVQSSTFTVIPSSSLMTYHWRYVHNGVSTAIPGTGPTITKKFGLGSYQIFAWGENTCGETDESSVQFNVLPCQNSMDDADTASAYKLTVAPNPVSSNKATVSLVALSLISKAESDRYIANVIVVDKFGNVKKQYNFKDKELNQQIDFSSLPADVYYVKVYDGQSWHNTSVIVQ